MHNLLDIAVSMDMLFIIERVSIVTHTPYVNKKIEFLWPLDQEFLCHYFQDCHII